MVALLPLFFSNVTKALQDNRRQCTDWPSCWYRRGACINIIIWLLPMYGWIGDAWIIFDTWGQDFMVVVSTVVCVCVWQWTMPDGLSPSWRAWGSPVGCICLPGLEVRHLHRLWSGRSTISAIWVFYFRHDHVCLICTHSYERIIRQIISIGKKIRLHGNIILLAHLHWFICYSMCFSNNIMLVYSYIQDKVYRAAQQAEEEVNVLAVKCDLVGVSLSQWGSCLFAANGDSI